MILSYLSSELGSEDEEKYKQFARSCKAETYEDLLEEYLKWLEGGNGKLERLIKWITEKLDKVMRIGGVS